jgi:N4-(beta-N-acetylglucosaminyl)-L-asparaginase
MSPREAAEDVVKRMLRKYPRMSSGIVVVNARGEHGGAGSGWTFTYAVRGSGINATQVITVPPVEANREELAGGATAYNLRHLQQEL